MEGEESKNFKAYTMIFPAPKTAIVVGLNPTIQDTLRSLMPERFNLDLVGNIFDSWLAAKPIIPENNHDSLSKFEFDSCFYEHDQLWYRSDIWTTKESNNKNSAVGGRIYTLHVKLSNDGFFYPAQTELDLFEKNISRRINKTYPKTWSLLGQKEFHHFQKLIDFACCWIKNNDPKILIYFNDTHDRIEVKVFDDQAGLQLCIALEPGYPELELTRDLWQKRS